MWRRVIRIPVATPARHASTTSGHSTAVRTMSLQTKISIGLLAVGSVSGSVAWHFALGDDAKTRITDALDATALGDVYHFVARIAAKVGEDPYKDKLLPDWPLERRPLLPVLVLDLEDTLVHSEWSRQHGWRHTKRPGVDEFLHALAPYYEIVVFSTNHMMVAQQIVTQIEPKQAVLHVVGHEARRYYNSAHVKDLSKLNRDLRHVVLVDDNPAAYALQPENAIPIRPYTNGRDREDHELKDLIPFLQALATESVGDFRAVLAEFRDEDGDIRNLPVEFAAHGLRLDTLNE